jgi:glycosyltransferase involved in cell wall biosynthesis
MTEVPAPGREEVPVSVMVFTLNEALHLPSCLGALGWCDDIIVVDSFSTDVSETLCREAGARFFQHAFTGFGDQRNWALDHCAPKHEWILILDADERVTPELVEEFRARLKDAPPDLGAFRVRRRFHFWGRWLRHSSLYPTWVVRLARRGRIRYVNRGHAETQEVEGRTGDLEHDLIDENLKGLEAWFERQNRYSTQEADYELAQEAAPFDAAGLFARDGLRRRAALKRMAGRLPFRPALYFLYAYVLRGGFLDGRDGFAFCMMKAMYQRMVAVKKYDLRRRRAR